MGCEYSGVATCNQLPIITARLIMSINRRIYFHSTLLDSYGGMTSVAEQLTLSTVEENP